MEAMDRDKLERLGRLAGQHLLRALDLGAAVVVLVVSGVLVLIAVSEVNARDALWQQAERLTPADFEKPKANARDAPRHQAEGPTPTDIDKSDPNFEDLEGRKNRTRVLVDALIQRGEAPENNGISGIRTSIGLQNGATRILASWDLSDPIGGATWAFARTRSDFLLAVSSILSGLIGVFLTRLPRNGRIVDVRECLQGAALSLVAFLLLRYGGQLAFVVRTSDAQDIKLNPFFTAIVGLLCGLERQQFQRALARWFRDLTTEKPGTVASSQTEAE